MKLIDSHTHLVSFLRRGTVRAAIAGAAAAGVERMITIGTEAGDWEDNRALAAAHPGVVDYTVGLHPTSVDEGWETCLPSLEAALGWDPAPVGLGEMGLDRFHLPKESREAEKVFERQRRAFAAQLELATRSDLPVIIHSRGAVPECVEMIDASGLSWARVVFHCFTDGPEFLMPILSRGGRASFTGIVTYKSAENVREALKVQPLDRLMVETDAPYLAPVPKRGQPNEPAFVRYTAEACGEILGLGSEEIASLTHANTMAFFRLG
ncbi:MAG: TatD family hydrolase [Opitutaceae bacterium]